MENKSEKYIQKLFEETRKNPALSDKKASKIHMPASLATACEHEMGIRDIKAAGLGGYKVVVHAGIDLYCFNQEKNEVTKYIEYSLN